MSTFITNPTGNYMGSEIEAGETNFPEQIEKRSITRKMANKNKKRVHVFVRGKVQGVFFRANTKKKAKKLGLAGWVKNLRDGRVEAVVEGEGDKVDKLVDWMRHGPMTANVEGLKTEEETPTGDLKDFKIRR